MSLCEFAYVSHKIDENKNDIDNNIEFLSTFLYQSSLNIDQRMVEILKNTSLYAGSFDVYHLAFAEYYKAKLVTFDKGFRKLQKISKIKLTIK